VSHDLPSLGLAFGYDLSLGEFVYRGELALPGSPGLNHDAVEVTVTEGAVVAVLVGWIFSGPMELRTASPERRAQGHDGAALRAVIDGAHRAALGEAYTRLEAALDRGEAWAPGAWQARALRLGIPGRAGREGERVAWSEADHLALWPSPVRSRDEDGTRPPVLLLGRTSDALAWPDTPGRDPVTLLAGTADGDAMIRARCGRAFAEVAAWFAADRAGRFPADPR
jgi:hypothetical protein